MEVSPQKSICSSALLLKVLCSDQHSRDTWCSLEMQISGHALDPLNFQVL